MASFLSLASSSFGVYSGTVGSSVFNTDCRLMQVRSIAECSKGSILHYFRPSLSPFSIKTSVLMIFESPLKTGFTVVECLNINDPCKSVASFQLLSPVSVRLLHLVYIQEFLVLLVSGN